MRKNNSIFLYIDSEPAESRKPTSKYRLYVFKGKEQIGIYLSNNLFMIRHAINIKSICLFSW